MERATRVLLARHGQTAWNVDSRIQGHLDIGLNEHGHWQAQRLAEAMAGETLAAIYSSDLQRARDTALAVSRRTGVPVQPEPALRERAFGGFEGKTFQELQQHHPQETERWRRRDPDFAPPGGESLEAFFARTVAAAERLARAHPGEAIALFTHGGVLDCLYRAATGQPLQAPRTWVLGNAALNRLLYGGEGFVLVGWNDAAHLDDGGDGEH